MINLYNCPKCLGQSLVWVERAQAYLCLKRGCGYYVEEYPDLHSGMDRPDAIAEARRLGDPSTGDGWRRLLWRMADLLEGKV